MAKVVNISEARTLLADLGWNLDVAEVVKALKAEQIPAAAFIAYARAFSRSRSGVDDAEVPGCPPGSGAKITAMLEERGLVLS